MTFDQQQAALIASVVRQVGLRVATPFWIIKDKKKRIVGGLNKMEAKDQVEWKQRAFKAYQICQHIHTSSVNPGITRATRLLSRAIKASDKKKVHFLKNDLIEFGIAYENVRMIGEAGLEVFDATYDQYASIPVPGFDLPTADDEGGMSWLPTGESTLEKQTKTSHHVADQMDKDAKEAGGHSGIPTFEEFLKETEDELDIQVPDT